MKVNIGPYPKNHSKERKIDIRIDNYDIWNADHTLSLIIHAVLVRYIQSGHGAPYVDDDDVPEELRSHNAPPKEHEWETDDFFFMRWDWITQEMLFVFERSMKEHEYDKFENYQADQERADNSMRLFSKYYFGLWT